jgi:tetratricopeptide (TPR) repeat protein
MRAKPPDSRLAPAFLLVLFAAGTGCASATHARRLGSADADGAQGWLALRDGKLAAASASFEHAIALDPADARARFGAMNLAFEHGDSEAALEHALALLEVASKGQDDQALALSTATLARVSRLLAETTRRSAAEERLLGLAPARLSWQAQYALALIAIDIARKRADEALLAKVSVRAGCAPAMTLVGSGGRLPSLDLDAETLIPADKPQSLLAAGCQFQLNAADSRNGVKVLHATLDLLGGQYDIVLDYSGSARLRVDKGPWHRHGGSPDVYGPRWSAERMEIPAGRHTVEIRLGSYGSTADLALLAMPAPHAKPIPVERASGGNGVMLELAAALVANLTGEVDVLLAGIEQLARQPRFALGLAAAGRLGEADPTRPADIMRDRGRALWQQALVVDPTMARVWLDLSKLELQNDRPREAAEKAAGALRAAPTWWPAQLALSRALRAQGLEEPADAALAQGLAQVVEGSGACEMIEQAFRRAEGRDDHPSAARLVERLGQCDAQDGNQSAWVKRHGDLDKALALLRRALPTSAEPLWLRSEIADILLAQGHIALAREELVALARWTPRDMRTRIRLADTQLSLGAGETARATLAEALGRFPGHRDLRQAARLAGLALPLDAYRTDGEQVIRDYLASGKTYQAPAVVILDRAVERVFSDGTRLVLTHSITQVLSKDALGSVGEVQVSEGAEILALRTRKANGIRREAEEIAGKSSISVPDLDVGDFVESETLEVKEPREAFAPGFVGERFYFQSFEAPLDRSEYVLIVPAAMSLDVNRRAGAPTPVTTKGRDGTQVLTFVVRGAAQAFAERAAVPASEWIPSVRVSSGVTLNAWSRFIADRMFRLTRGSPEVRQVAAAIVQRSGGDRDHLPEAIVAWVREHIEPETDLGELATVTLARHRGNRAGLILALARSLGVSADFVLARSLLQAEASASVSAAELDDFRELLVRFPSPGGDRFVDPQIRRAPFAYLLPGFDGAPAVVVGTQQVVKAVSGVKDSRSVTLRARLDSEGGARVAVTEQLSGWPAVEWTELLDRVGKDRSKLRQDFEQRWLGRQFPGAELDTLAVEPGDAGVGTRVSYTFKSTGMAARQGSVLRLHPVFFQAQPGRRFGSEPSRKTALMLGYEVPLDLDAEIVLPGGARVIDMGQGGNVIVGGASFREERQVGASGDGAVSIVLKRRSRLPIMRVVPGDYLDIAAKLRAVDPVEQGEIKIAVPGK